MARWPVDYLGVKDKHFGTVEAPDEKSAIAMAMKTFHITPARRLRIMVTKTFRWSGTNWLGMLWRKGGLKSLYHRSRAASISRELGVVPFT
jgi:hypothetical protein